MSAPELQAFHIGIVVHDAEATIERYKAMLGVDRWHLTEPRPNGTRVAYGRGAGQTWELFEVKGPGTTQHHQFRDQHGEGVHHIGFWTPDVKASVQQALDAGAQLVSASTDAQGNAVVELLPGPYVTREHFESFGIVTFVDPGLGGVRMEFIGQAGEAFLRDWFKDDFDNIVIPPPW